MSSPLAGFPSTTVNSLGLDSIIVKVSMVTHQTPFPLPTSPCRTSNKLQWHPFRALQERLVGGLPSL